jgi:hypothetical protein
MPESVDPTAGGVEEYNSQKGGAPEALGGLYDANLSGPGAVQYPRPGERVSDAYVTHLSENRPKAVSGEQILQRLLMLSPAARRELQRKLIEAGNLPANYKVTGMVDAKFKSAMQEIFSEAASMNTEVRDANGNVIQKGYATWQDYLADKIRSVQAGESEGGKGGDGKGGRTTYTNVTRIDPTSAQASLRELIGRDPSQGELDKFMSAYNKAAAKSPSVTVQDVDADGNVTSTTSGGFDAETLARNVAQDTNPDYANYQAVATYFPVFQQLFGGADEIGNVVTDVS